MDPSTAAAVDDTAKEQLGSVGEDARGPKLPALHQADVTAVLGAPLADVWECGLCGRQSRGVPAAFLKQGGRLVPLCFRCLLERENEVDSDGTAGLP